MIKISKDNDIIFLSSESQLLKKFKIFECIATAAQNLSRFKLAKKLKRMIYS